MHRRLFSIATSIAAFAATAIHAHHAISSYYDSSRRVTIDGFVTQFQLINPHPFLFVEVKDEGGRPQPWRLEMDNRGELAEIGVTSATFRPGDRVIVSGSLGRTDPRSLYVLRLDRPVDGFWYEQVGTSPRIRTKAR